LNGGGVCFEAFFELSSLDARMLTMGKALAWECISKSKMQ